MNRRRLLVLLALLSAALPVPALPAPTTDPAIALAEFVLRRPLDPAAQDRILAGEQAAAARDPAGQARARESVRVFLAQVSATQDGLQRLRLFAHVRAVIVFDWDNPDGAAVRNEILAAAPLVAADPATRHVVLRSDLDALLRSNALVAELAGVPPPPVDPDALAAEIARDFARYPPAVQASFAGMAWRAALLERRWTTAGAAERAATTRRVRAMVRGTPAVARFARAMETTAFAGRPLQNTGNVDAGMAAMAEATARSGILAGLRGALYGFNP
jgi:hypothetical protein